MEGPEIQSAEAVIDNGRFGTRTVRFETGRLARQAAGSVVAYLDSDTTLLSTTTSTWPPSSTSTGSGHFPPRSTSGERTWQGSTMPRC